LLKQAARSTDFSMGGENTMRRCYEQAFTLLEMMIVLAVLAIVTVLAYSSYTESVRKANRGDAQAALTGLASAMQRYYTESTPSTFVGAAASGPPGPPIAAVFPSQAPLDGANKHYDLRIQSAAASTFELRAIPISGSAQAGDKCGTLTLTSTGQRGIDGGQSGVTWQNCWR
jgi:type IV pilus assembly protein PilE